MQIKKALSINELGKRQNNEDCIFPQNSEANSRFFLVCDGMGGHENGEVASASVCSSFGKFLQYVPVADFNQTVFENALDFAYSELDKQEDENPSDNPMGTTLTFIYFTPETAFMAHIGDSRIYHIRKKNGIANILYQSQDHSLVNNLVKAGIITEEEARIHPKRNVITQAMIPHLENPCKPDIYETTDILSGDLFFLCTDGVLEQIDNARLLEIVAKNANPETILENIRQICNDWSNDNFSAYLIEME